MRARWVIFAALALGLAFAPSAGAQGSGPSNGIQGVPSRIPAVRTVAPSAGICLKFDDLAVGSTLTSYHSVRFMNSDGALRVQNAYPGPPFSSPNSILPDNYSVPGNYSQAKPPVLVRAAAVTLGDYDADSDTIYLNAYDSTGSLVASDTDVLPAGLNGGIQLSVQSSSVNISYIQFYGVGVSENSVYFDNVCFAQ